MDRQALEEILRAHPELEVSEWSPPPLPDPHPAGDAAGGVPAVPAGGPDPDVPRVVREDAAPAGGPVLSPVCQPAIETPAPRRRGRKPKAQEAGGNGTGQGADELAGIFRTIREVAALLRIHEKSTYRLIYEGRLPAIRVGRLLIPAEAVHQFIQSRRVQPRPWAMRKSQGTP